MIILRTSRLPQDERASRKQARPIQKAKLLTWCQVSCSPASTTMAVNRPDSISSEMKRKSFALSEVLRCSDLWNTGIPDLWVAKYKSGRHAKEVVLVSKHERNAGYYGLRIWQTSTAPPQRMQRLAISTGQHANGEPKTDHGPGSKLE